MRSETRWSLVPPLARELAAARRAGLGLALAALLAACGGGELSLPAAGGDTAPIDQDTVDPGTPDALPGDTAAPGDADPADSAGPPDVGPPKKGFGEPCETLAECESGFCVLSAAGRVCSQGCADECPAGWACRAIADAGLDPVFICVDPAATLCHPCGDDADCNQPGTGSANRCLAAGSAGSFCGIACSAGSNCPAGYTCAPQEAGAPGQCVPDGQECACNPLATALSLSTACANENAAGRCEGVRTCTEAGLSGCGAPVPAEETCNGQDDDCDGEIDEALDGSACLVTNAFGACPGVLTCADGAPTCAGPEAAAESCNGLDDDCDGETDEGVGDFDQDGIGDCLDPDDDDDGWPDVQDCAPLDAAINPGATEACNGVDDDCDAKTDEAAAEGCGPWYRDLDGDGAGSDAVPPACLCGPDAGTFFTAAEAGDCNDLEALVGPGATELCNEVDDDCDGETDEGTDVDTDGDGELDCTDLDDDNDGWPDDVDCAPLDPAINPSAKEACGGGDEDCDGKVDEAGAVGCAPWFKDQDGDGQAPTGATPLCLCGPAPATQHTAQEATDCDDTDAGVYLGAAEICNGKDDDCDGTTDDGGAVDTDGDGLVDCVDEDDDGDGAPDGEDCAPLDAAVYPGATEACDGKDDDCDGKTDEAGAEGCAPWYPDADGDGYGKDGSASACLCGPDPGGVFVAPATGDCNDASPAVSPAAAEVCNFVDDDCDDEVDDGVASPCGTCSPTCVLGFGDDTTLPYEPTPDNSNGVEPADEGGITLATTTLSFPFIWVANSAEDTVSKLNTETGCEVARYKVCVNPSRTAVDLEGNGIITCRGDGRVAKVAILPVDCIDKDGSGAIETSADANGDCVISSGEMVANDECVRWVSQPDGPNATACGESALGCARAAGVDAGNDVWVGLWNSQRLAKLDGETGAELVSFPMSGNPYGLAVDADGTIWVASRDPFTLHEIDPDLGQVKSFVHPSNECYGLALDPFGKVWVAGGSKQTVARFDPDTETWSTPISLPYGYTRGVAVRNITDTTGKITGAEVYVGHHSWDSCAANGKHRTVSVIDAVTLEVKTPFDLGADRGAVGVAVDNAGKVWSVNQCDSSATRIDPLTGTVLGTWPVGLGPYTYSDMTGYALRNVTTPQGFYRQVFDGWQGSATLWDKLWVEAELPGVGASYLEVSWRAADTVADLGGAPWQGPFGPFPPQAFPLDLGVVANHLEVRLTLGTVDQEHKPVVKSLSVLAFEQ